MRLVISSLLTLATAVLVAADVPLFNPPVSILYPSPHTSPANSVRPIVGRMTNAKRLSMKLPLLKPKSLQRDLVGSAPRSDPLMEPLHLTSCNIRATGTDGTDFGFISPVWNFFREYGQFQSAQEGSLKITFNASPDDSELDFFADNGPRARFPFFGAINGFSSDSDNFGSGSHNYAYIGGTTRTLSGSTPQFGDNSFTDATGIPETIESAIWKYNPNTQQITAQWINTDGSRPATYIVFVNDSNQSLALTGDVGSFQSTFGPYPEVTFTCVTPLPVQQVKK